MNTAKIKNVAIILVNYKGKEDTLKCISSLYKSSYKFFSIILIDNASEDDVLEEVKALFPAVVLIANDENIGFARANNIGIKYAMAKKFEFVWLLNNDTFVNNDTLHNMIDSSHEMSVLSPLIYFDSPSDKIWFSGGKYSPYFAVGKHVSYEEFNKSRFGFLTACALFVPVSVFEKIGLLDENIFMYAEDLDFSIRAKHCGYTLSVIKNAYLWHKGSASSVKRSSFSYYNHVKNIIYAVCKNHGSAYLFIIVPFHIFKALYVLSRSFRHNKFAIFSRYLAGIIDGVALSAKNEGKY